MYIYVYIYIKVELVSALKERPALNITKRVAHDWSTVLEPLSPHYLNIFYCKDKSSRCDTRGLNREDAYVGSPCSQVRRDVREFI